MFNSLLGLFGVERSNILILVARSNGESLGFFEDFGDPLGRVSDHNCDRNSHAPLASGSETGSD